MNDEMNTVTDNNQQTWEQLSFECDELYDVVEDEIDGEKFVFVVYRGILDITVGENNENI